MSAFPDKPNFESLVNEFWSYLQGIQSVNSLSEYQATRKALVTRLETVEATAGSLSRAQEGSYYTVLRQAKLQLDRLDSKARHMVVTLCDQFEVDLERWRAEAGILDDSGAPLKMRLLKQVKDKYLELQTSVGTSEALDPRMILYPDVMRVLSERWDPIFLVRSFTDFEPIDSDYPKSARIGSPSLLETLVDLIRFQSSVAHSIDWGREAHLEARSNESGSGEMLLVRCTSRAGEQAYFAFVPESEGKGTKRKWLRHHAEELRAQYLTWPESMALERGFREARGRRVPLRAYAAEVVVKVQEARQARKALRTR